MTKTREFVTVWGSPAPRMWFDREREELLGSAAGTKYDIPNFRPFDMLSEPSQSLRVWQNRDMRIGVESVVGEGSVFTLRLLGDSTPFESHGPDGVAARRPSR